MAKSTGKAQGRSGGAGQGGRERQGKSNPEAPRGGGRNGAAGRPDKQSAQSRSNERPGRGQGGDEQQKSGVAGRVGDTVKEHPITAAAVGAGVALLAAQGLRMALGAGSNSSRGASDENEEDSSSAEGSAGEEEQDEDSDEEGEQEEGDEGGGMMGRLRGGAARVGSAFGGSAQAIKRGASSGYERGRDAATQGWQNHPLLLCGLAVAVGAGVGLLLPTTRQEDRLMGEAADKVTGRIKSAGQEFFRQGKQIAGKVVGSAVDATSKEAEREGLTPDRLGKKVKRLVSHVRDAVSEAIEE